MLLVHLRVWDYITSMEFQQLSLPKAMLLVNLRIWDYHINEIPEGEAAKSNAACESSGLGLSRHQWSLRKAMLLVSLRVWEYHDINEIPKGEPEKPMLLVNLRVWEFRIRINGIPTIDDQCCSSTLQYWFEY
eukprot:CAMPEP_0113638856 /NCGR_PEP_ID=MMETSP0017_2-20120614/20369_1 /TAXON_ID=2856 /ORGANISM="Cylindrotheca closterium" /LENGTH=131 /DNA_ID=CAMNT_0000550011 /DNA_START=752 /DNA_END=1147 /DNA_ORIENTATION=- /assembly_acc=CAM_ASM_000147